MSYRNRRPRTFDEQGWSADPEDWEKVSRAKANLDELERLVPDAGPRPALVFLPSGREAAAHRHWQDAAMSKLFHRDEDAWREFKRRARF